MRDRIYADYLYGADASQFVRVWPPKAPSASPATVVFVLHGGFWRERYGLNTVAGTACEGVAPALAARGVAAVEVEYRRGRESPFPAAAGDIVDAVQFVHDVLARPLRLRVEGCCLLGFSAGGTLALCAALDLPDALRPRVVVAVAPVANLERAARLRLSDDGEAVQAYMAGMPEEKPSEYARACPTCRAAELVAYPGKVVIVVGSDDTDVPCSVTGTLRDAMWEHDGPNAASENYVKIPSVDHYQLMDTTSSAWPTIVDILGL